MIVNKLFLSFAVASELCGATSHATGHIAAILQVKLKSHENEPGCNNVQVIKSARNESTSGVLCWLLTAFAG